MRSTCLRCSQEGVETELVPTIRGNICPVHEADFLATLRERAEAVLGLTRPSLLGKSVPSRSSS